jgi:xanthine dehydrogenase large subunit
MSTPLPQDAPVHRSLRHDSADAHVKGRAVYIDDIAEPRGLLHAALVTSPVAHGRLRAIETTAARAMPGVHRIITAADIPGRNDIAPIGQGEVLFAADLVECAGQPVAAVLAETLDQARAAAAAVTLAIDPLPPALTVREAMAAQSYVRAPMRLEHGDVDAALAKAPHRVRGSFEVGGQEHFYLEGQVALAWIDEGGGVAVQSSTQHPSEVQHICARLLGVDYAGVTVMVRRMGGGFGGKESNASWVAGVAAVGSRLTGRPVKLRLPRPVDMVVTGKRHGFVYDFEAGFDDDGRVLGLDCVLAANAGYSLDMTAGVIMRALTHVDNCYHLPALRAVGLACKTNTVSNTAFRGFGGPQGVVLMEEVIEHIAQALGRTPEQVRAVNYYGAPGSGRDVTPYEQPVRDNVIGRVVTETMELSDWEARRAEIDAFNASHPTLRRGLGLFPLKFGLSFGALHLNQAGALVQVYADGSVRLSHGGTEMGQGLFIKVAQVVATVFGVDTSAIRLSTTSTAEVPNTSATAASTGSDLNGWAAWNAATAIRGRLAAVAAAHFDVAPEEIVFAQGRVGPGGADNRSLGFGELARMAYLQRVQLSESGFYKVPDLSWDGERMKGQPYFYFVYGAAVSEVAVDLLTGEIRVLRADIVEDCGTSLNPAVDIGQVEGAYVQGLGWLVCENLHWNAQGKLLSHGPSTYKIPGSRDVPKLNTRLLEGNPSAVATIFRSKGVGEPPLLLATSIWTAVKDALKGLGTPATLPVRLDAPMVAHRVLDEIDRLRGTPAA